MKLVRLLPLVVLLAGCGSRGDTPPQPDAGLSKGESLRKIQNDSKMPDGLKKIKMETLQRQPGG